MKPLLSIKTLYRAPIKTLLTFILLVVVTFAFFSQTAEYAITAREFGNAARQYCGVGSAEIAPPEEPHSGDSHYINADPRMAQFYPKEEKEKYLNTLRYQPLTQEQISAISALPYITSTDTRYMTAGISDTYYRLDDKAYFYNYSSRCVIEGTLTEVILGPQVKDTGGWVGGGDGRFNQLILDDCKLLAGNPVGEVENETVKIQTNPSNYDEGEEDWLNGGNQRKITAYSHSYMYDTAYVKNMTPGSRYVFVLRFDPLDQHNYQQNRNEFFLGDYLSDSWCDAVWPLDGAPADYLETDKFAPLRELALITNTDMHTFDLVYTNDMRAILRFAEGKMAILDGRALTQEDSISDANVCVVSRDFAEANALKVGNEITIKRGTALFEQYKALGAVAVAPERYKPPGEMATLEIVGIYADTDGSSQQSREPNWSYSVNTIFVPVSLLPVDADKLAGHVFSPSEFSFKVENAWDISDFLVKTAPLFEEMGLKPVFYDDGWPDIARGFRAARELSIIKIAVLSAAVAAADVFVVYLFISRKKKEYAVMRALGTTSKVAARALLLPLSAVAGAAVLAGSCAAWIYTVKTIDHNNALSMLKEYSVSTSIPAGAVIGCIAGEILLTLFIALVLLRRVGAQSPLSLLQDNGGRKTRAKANRLKPVRHGLTAMTIAAPYEAVAESAFDAGAPIGKSNISGVGEPVRMGRKRRSPGFGLRYIWKHIRRSAGKSVLSVLLAALLFLAVGQLALMKQSYTRLCTDTVITADFVGGLPLDAVPQIRKTGYVKNPYYEARATVELNLSGAPGESIVFTNDITRYTGEADITYADGYDASMMDKFGKVIIAGKTLMAQYGLELGDTVMISRLGFYDNLRQFYIGTYRSEHPEDDITDEEILALSHDAFMKQLNYATRTYTIAGVVSTASGVIDNMAFTPGDSETSLVVGHEVKLDVAEVTLADNFRADEFRSYGEKIAGGSATDGVVLIMDTSKLENLINSLRLLETLYPVALAAALLIGGFLCCLVIVQSSREAAIMRILGTTKGKTRAMLALEQLLLSIVGLVIGACGLLLYKGSALSVISGQLSVFAALYFAVILVSAVICSAAATRRNVLELLQTKE